VYGNDIGVSSVPNQTKNKQKYIIQQQQKKTTPKKTPKKQKNKKLCNIGQTYQFITVNTLSIKCPTLSSVSLIQFSVL
jgi:hypothetical protein